MTNFDRLLVEEERPASRSLAVQRADAVESRPVDWLWPQWLPCGLYGEVGGWPGLGKSLTVLDLLAHLTRRGKMPDGQPSPGPLHVGIAAAEDAIDTVVVPRLKEAGADLRRVHIIEGVTVTMPASDLGAGVHREGIDPLTVPLDLPLLADYIACYGLGLLYVDALTDVLARFESHRDADTRRALAPLARFARTMNVTTLGVRHFAKLPPARAAHASGGSIAFSAVARFMLQVHADADDPDRRVLAVAKSNLAALPGSLAFRLAAESPTATPRIEWLGPDARTADDLLAASLAHDRHAGNGDGQPAGANAGEWLAGVLMDGVRDQREILDAARQNGYATATVYRAAEKLGVEMSASGFGKAKRSTWTLPVAPVFSPSLQSSHTQGVKKLEQSEKIGATEADPDEVARAAMRDGA